MISGRYGARLWSIIHLLALGPLRRLITMLIQAFWLRNWHYNRSICNRLCENPPCSRILYIFTKTAVILWQIFDFFVLNKAREFLYWYWDFYNATPNYTKVMAFWNCKNGSKFAREHGGFSQSRSHISTATVTKSYASGISYRCRKLVVDTR